jgi:hydrogenase maturation factor HypE
MAEVGDIFSRAWENIGGRTGGTMSFRFIMQPLVAAFFAVRAAIRDVKVGSPPYLATLIRDSEKRRGLLREGWKDVGKVFVFACLLDAIYQIIVLKWFYVGETLIVAALLAFVPYILIRGPLARIWRKVTGKK